MLSPGIGFLTADPGQGGTVALTGDSLEDALNATSAVWDDVNGVAYIFGGTSTNQLGGDEASQSVLEYEPDTGNAMEIRTLPDANQTTPVEEGRTATSAVWDGSAAYIFGGRTSLAADTETDYVPQIVKFTPGSDPSVVADLKPGRSNTAAAISEDGTAYIFGGITGGDTPTNGRRLNTITSFTPSTGVVNDVGTLPSNLANATAVWDGERGVAYIFGGDTPAGQQSTVWEFDPDGTVDTVGSLETERVAASSVMTPHGAVIFGGSHGGPLDSADRFLPGPGTTDAWHDLTDARHGTSAVFDGDGNAYLFGGEDAAGSYLDNIINYSVGPVVHERDLVPDEPYPPDAVTLEENGDAIDATFKLHNPHAACNSNEVGCKVPAGTNVSVYLASQAQLESAGISDTNLSDLTVAELDDYLINERGSPDKKTTLAQAIGPGKTRKVTLDGLSLSGFGKGEVVTVIGVADWCSQRYVDDDPSEPCDIVEDGAGDPEKNILYHQWIIPPGLNADLVFKAPKPRDELAASLTETTEVRVNVEPAVPLDRQVTLNYTVTMETGELACPGEDRGANLLGPDPCHTEFDGIDDPQVHKRVAWDSDVAGERTLRVTLGYPNITVEEDQPANYPTGTFVEDTYYYHAVDWVAEQTLETDSAVPAEDAIRVDSTIANDGDLAANASGVGGGKVELAWQRCNRLLQVDNAYQCGDKTRWVALNGSLRSKEDYNLDDFPPGGSRDDKLVWGTARQSAGLWSIRSVADNRSLWDNPRIEHNTSNNQAVDTLRLGNVSWGTDSRVIEQEFVDLEKGAALNHSLSIDNVGSQAEDVEVLMLNTTCNPECDGENWLFTLWDSSEESRVNDSRFPWHPRPNKRWYPANLSGVGPGPSNPLAFEVVPKHGKIQPDHFVNATLVVCAADPGFSDDGSCEGEGDVIEIRSFFDPPWDPQIEPQSPIVVPADPGEDAAFFFKVVNGADEVDDAFTVNADIEQSGKVQPLDWKRLEPVEETCTSQKHTVDPDHDITKAARCSNTSATSMAPGEDNRFRFRTTVNDGVEDGTVVNITVTASSRNSTERDDQEVVKTQLFQVTVGTDVGPPRIEASPSSGSTIQPGREIEFNVTDDNEVASVERRIDDGRFEPFGAEPYTVSTEGRSDGDLKIDVRARDDGGDEQTRTFRYTIDGTPPSFQAVQVDPSVVFVGGTFDVAVGLSEDNPESVTARTAGGSHELTFSSATGLFEVDGISAPDQADVYSLEVTAIDEAGNQASRNTSYEVVEPDISIATEDVTSEPRSPTVGETVTVTAKVSNPTGAEVTGYPVSLTIDGQTVANATITLVPNAKTAVTFEWTAEEGGHDLAVCGDPADTIPDPDRENQCGQLSIRVRDQSLIPGPEIVIIAAALVLGALGRRRWDARDAHQRDTRD